MGKKYGKDGQAPMAMKHRACTLHAR